MLQVDIVRENTSLLSLARSKLGEWVCTPESTHEAVRVDTGCPWSQAMNKTLGTALHSEARACSVDLHLEHYPS